jgi:hypothetical protein
MKYWNPEDQDLIQDFYYAQYQPMSAETRNAILTTLIPTLEKIARVNLYECGVEQTPENINHLLTEQTTYIIPHIKSEKFKAAYEYIYQSTYRYIFNRMTTTGKHDVEFGGDTLGGIPADRTYNSDYNQGQMDIRSEILDALDKKIEEQRVINKTITIFLIHMKTYIIDNDYDVRGFDQYVQKQMNIKKSTYCSLISRCGIRSKIFNEPIIKDNQN